MGGEDVPESTRALLHFKRGPLAYADFMSYEKGHGNINISIVGHVQPSVILYQVLASKEPKIHIKLDKSFSLFLSEGPNYHWFY